ncbi:MAG: hypothetical protein ACI81P_001913 [Neolewinella sp.]|jgi:hypothetical protein
MMLVSKMYFMLIYIKKFLNLLFRDMVKHI